MDEQLHARAGQPEGAFPLSSPQSFTPSAMDYPAMAAPRPPRSPRSALPRWLKVGGVAAALVLGVGGAAAGANALIAHAANGLGGASPFSILSQAPFAGHTGHPSGFGGHQRGGDLTVSSVSGQTITTKDAGGATVTVKVSSSTHYTRLGKAVSLSAITAAETIHVRGTRNSDGSIAASRIDIEVPTYGGQVTAISGSDITIQGRQGASHTVHTTTSTTIKRGDATSTVSAIAVGDQIVASGARNSDGSLNAEQIMVQLPHADGQIQSVSSSALTVKDRRGNTITIHLSASTRYMTVSMGANGPTQSATTFSALKSGAYISAEGVRNSDGSLNAEVVTVIPAAPNSGSHGNFGGGPHGDHDDGGPNGSNSASDTSTN